ncbi:MAG: hypothetical protein ABJA11_05785 [Pseudolysinimonas sp.]
MAPPGSEAPIAPPVAPLTLEAPVVEPLVVEPPTVTPVSGAFGVAVPYPVRDAVPQVMPPVGTDSIVFPPVVSREAVVPATSVPPASRAPELMGADELAAAPRTVQQIGDQAPPRVTPLVAPSNYGAPSAAGEPEPEPEPTPSPSLSRPQNADPAPATPLPSPATPPSSAAAPSPPMATPRSASSTPSPAPSVPSPTPRATVDFAALLATPTGAHSEVRASAGPEGSEPVPSEEEPDLGRSTLLERIGLGLSVVVGPVGLIVGIVNAARSAHRRGWVIGLVRASIAIGVVMTVVIAIGGYYQYTQFKQQQQHAQTAAASAAFCAAIKAQPSMVQLPTFGWPAVAASIPDSLTAMQAYQDRWEKLAKVSPAGIKADVSKVAAAAKAIIADVTVARTVDDPSNVAVMSSLASTSGVPAWHSEYCG